MRSAILSERNLGRRYGAAVGAQVEAKTYSRLVIWRSYRDAAGLIEVAKNPLKLSSVAGQTVAQTPYDVGVRLQTKKPTADY